MNKQINPFKFLDAYTREDRDIFFGRDQEIKELYHKVFESKLLVLYGISGSGKTSLINCGLANKFMDSDWQPVNIRRGKDIITSLYEELSKVAITKLHQDSPIVKTIQSLYLDRFKPVYLIFDQFEELFIFGDRQERKNFIQITKDIMESDVQCKCLFSIREEYFAGMTEFENSIPEFLSNRVRVERMTRQKAIEVIEGPCAVNKIEIEKGFADSLLSKLNPDSGEIELTYLQVILDKIFRTSGDNKKLTHDQIKHVGDVSDILGSFLEEQIGELNDPDTGLVVLKAFVSMQGTKKKIGAEEIKGFAETMGTSVENDKLKDLLQRFVNLRVLKDKDEHNLYELRHDSLAAKIFEKFTLVEKELLDVSQFIDNAFTNYIKRGKLLGPDDLAYITPYINKLIFNKKIDKFLSDSIREVEKLKRRSSVFAIAASLALIIVLSGFTVWAIIERREAVEQRESAESQKDAAIEANKETERAREEALLEKQKAEENERIAIDRTNDALLANEIAEAERQRAVEEKYRAEDNERQALIAKEEAEKMRSLAEKEKTRADNERVNALENYQKAKANNLIFHANNVMEDDPTIALRLAEEASKLDQNDNITSTLHRIYRENNFYKTVANTGAAIKDAAFSPDGKYVLTGSEDHLARLWDLSGNMVQVFEGHKFPVTSVAFAPDENTVLTGSEDGTARLWDFSGRLLRVFQGHEGYITSVAYSPDGNSVLTGSLDNTARIWALDGTEIQTFKDEQNILGFGKAIFSPDGKTILSQNYSGTFNKKVRLWDVNGRSIKAFNVRDVRVTNISYTPDGEPLIIGIDKEGALRLYNINGKPANSLISNYLSIDPFNITSSAVSPDFRTISTGHRNGDIHQWDLFGKIIQTYKGHNSEVNSLAFSPDGKMILSGSVDQTARLWLQTGGQINSFYLPWGFFDIKLSSDGVHLITTAYGGSLYLMNLSGDLVQSLEGHENIVGASAFSPDGKLIITGSADRTVRIWDLEGVELHVFKGHHHNITEVAISPNNNILFTQTGRDAQLWETSGRVIKIFDKTSDTPMNGLFSPDGNLFIVYTDNREFLLIDLNDYSMTALQGSINHSEKADVIFSSSNSDSLTSMEFSPDSKKIITGTREGMAYLWNVKGDIVSEFRGHFDAVTSVRFTPDGSRIFTGSSDETLRLWDVSGELLQLFSGHNAEFSTIVISPRGNTILSGNSFSTPYLWDLSGNLLHNFAGDRDKLDDDFFDLLPFVKYSADGNSIIVRHRNDEKVSQQEIKMFLEDFQERNFYDTLDIPQRIEYGILEFNDVITMNSEENMCSAARYYFSKAQEFTDRLELLEYLNHSVDLYEKILEINSLNTYLQELEEILNYLGSLEPSHELTKKSLDIEKVLLKYSQNGRNKEE